MGPHKGRAEKDSHFPHDAGHPRQIPEGDTTHHWPSYWNIRQLTTTLAAPIQLGPHLLISQPFKSISLQLEIGLCCGSMSEALRKSRKMTTSVGLPWATDVFSVCHRRPPDWSGMICPEWSHADCFGSLVHPSFSLKYLPGGFIPCSSQSQTWGSPTCSSTCLPFYTSSFLVYFFIYVFS